MISTIFFEDALIELMVSTTCATTVPPLPATAAADCASWLACRALSAFCLTVPVSATIEAAVCSSELACACVRCDKSRLPAAMSCEAPAMSCVPPRTSPTMVIRLAFISFSACSSWPTSSADSTRILPLRSPPATLRATFTACRRGRTMPLLMNHAVARLSTPPTTPSEMISTLVSCARRIAAPAAARICADCAAICPSMRDSSAGWPACACARWACSCSMRA